jgi:FAD/FMN-containing dehydrogenase
MTAQAESIEGLRTAVRGRVITPADTGYDDARRVWNAVIDRRPAAIVRCRSAADVIATVNFARDNDFALAVRGGAHNVAGRCTCDDGIVIDFSEMKSIRVDPAAEVVRAEPGLRWAELDRETQAFGLATTGGTVGDTGIAGLTLGGGFGWLGGRHGMTADNLIGADVVLANGTLVHASDRENPDLLWALRGGGGNFGVVTSFEYKVHPIGPMIVGGIVVHPFPQAADALRFYGEFIREAPDDLTVAAVMMTAPDGQKACGLVAAHAGPVEEGMKAVEPLKAFGTPVIDMIGAVPYVAQQSLLEAAMPPNVRNYWKADFVPEVSSGVIDVAVSSYARAISPMSALLFFPIHGRASRIAADATAYPHRRGIHFGIYALWNDPSEDRQQTAWVRQTWDAVQPYVAGGVYVNELGEDEGDNRVQEAYAGNYERLREIKRKYDPDNLFCLNANIKP